MTSRGTAADNIEELPNRAQLNFERVRRFLSYTALGLIRWAVPLFLLICFIQQPAEAQDDWRQVRSNRFTIVGDADAVDTQGIIARLEGFQGAVGQFFLGIGFRPLPPVTAFVMEGRGEFRGTGLEDRENGVFVRRHQTYFILTDPDNVESLGELLHLYFLEIAAANIPNMPFWIQEGLAAFYSTASWSDDGGQLITGLPIDSYVRRIQDTRDHMGYTRLSAITVDSEAYDEMNRDSLFHAESWALIHFLMTREDGLGHDQTADLVRLIASGLPFDEAVENVFDVGLPSLLNEFENHVEGRDIYPQLTLSLDPEIATITSADDLPEVDAATYLGALLNAAGFSRQAETQLGRAIAMETDSARPYTAVAPLLIDQERFDEARFGLDRALSRRGADHMTHYYYALTLLRKNAQISVNERARAERELRTAIDINAGFADGYYELSMSLMDTPDGSDEAASLLQTALDLDPRHPDYLMAYSRILIDQGRIDDARNVLLPLMDGIVRDEETRERAVEIMESIAERAGQRGLIGEGFAEITTGSERPTASSDEPGIQAEATRGSDESRVRLSRVVDGEQQTGLLTLIDCRVGLTLTLEDRQQVHLFSTDSPERVEFSSATNIGSEISCGIQDPSPRVVVTFRPGPAGSELRGVPVKVEFIED